MYSSVADSCASLHRSHCVLYIVLAPERTAAARQAGNNDESLRHILKTRQGLVLHGQVSLDISVHGGRTLRAKPPSDNAEGNTRLW